jgi:carbamoyltransferase
MTTTLGINDGHDAGAALVRDGKVLAAVQEERVTNIKHYSGVPAISINEVFRIAKVDPSEIDGIGLVSLIRVYLPLKERPLKVRLFDSLSPYLHSKSFTKLYVKILHRFRKMKELKKALAPLGLLDKEISFVEHHTAHASCAYRTSPWGYAEPTLVMTIDGYGDGVSASVNVGRDGEIARIAWSTHYDSPGNSYYSAITEFLGMKPWDHEYKTMGLAPYGRPDICIDKMRRIIRLNPANPMEFQNTFRSYSNSMIRKLRTVLAGERFDNIAAACQEYYEELFTAWVRNAVTKTGIRKVAFAGGNILNVKANQKVLEIQEVEDAFFYPAAGDEGTATGAALQTYYDTCQADGAKAEHCPLEDLYYGPEYDNEAIWQAIKAQDLTAIATKHGEISHVVGDLLANQNIVARFDGRLEWGPRALGNRSILADPRNQRVVRELNTAVKQRDFWMPFAPTILEERMHDYLIDARPSRYMILAFETTEKREEIIAAIHPQDYTARPQTLNDWNEGYRNVIETFQSATGVGAVLNTSFNLHGYPIVGTPDLALWTFKNSGLEYLAIGDYLLKK